MTMDQARAFADRFVQAAFPCDPDTVGPLIDERALLEKVAAELDASQARGIVDRLSSRHFGRDFVCSATKTQSLKVLRVRMIAGAPRPLLRRISTSGSVAGVDYQELELGASRHDHEVRVVDVYEHMAGNWLSASIWDVARHAVHSGDADTSDRIGRARNLQLGGKSAEALTLLDTLPKNLRKTRTVLLARVSMARDVSDHAYRQALDELAAAFPDDPSIALIETPGALLHKDYDAALRYVDLVDKGIGGDPFQDAVRASIYLQRGRPGDLDRAAARAEAATRAEPDLAQGWWERLDVEIARKRWGAAIEVMDVLRRRFGRRFDDARLRANPTMAGLVASPEYAAWRAQQGITGP